MAWPRGAQRVLLVLAAGLLALGVWLGSLTARQQEVVTLPDDPALDLRLELNGASAADLESLPGVGPALAAKIVAHRSGHGSFRTVDDLRQVQGVGEKLVATLRPLVTVAAAP